MNTAYDWIAIAVFCGLVVLFLQRSVAEKEVDTVWHYLPPAAGCAFSNWLGNNGYPFFAILMISLTVSYIFFVLKPFPAAR
jgi:hypothetical protein